MLLRHLFEDAEVGQITPHNVDDKYAVGKVLIDNQKGVGAAGNNGNVLYMGFVAFIKPSDFLNLASKSGDRHDRATGIEAAQEGRGIGSPFLILGCEHEKAPWGRMFIAGHEGRARMTIIEKLNGDELFPIQFFPRPVRGELRSRHLDQSFFEAMKHLKTESGLDYDLELHRVFCGGKEYKL